MAPSHVLVPLDGSPLALDALVHALETYDCRVTVLQVVKPLDDGMSEGASFVTDQERVREADERLTDLVADARDRVGASSQAVDTVIETGGAAETILTYADDHGVDHIVMGGHGGDGGPVARRLLGTVSTRVLGEAAIPVTVIR